MTPYVVDPRTGQGLMVTRSLGDHALRRIGITPEPEIVAVALTPDAVGVVLATDGLWDVVTTAEAAAACRQAEPQRAAERLVALVGERDGSDNVTVVVARFAAM
jgi:serine/threonine protein phosphatase PrpC